MLTLGGSPIPRPAWKFMRSECRTDPQEVLIDLRMHFPPTCVVRICEELDIELRSATESTWYAAVKSTSERAIIWVNTRESKEYQRMSIAMCLGSLLKYPVGDEYKCSGNITEQKDQSLFKYASELLVPEHLLLARSSYFGRSVSNLSKLFMVPEGTMIHRYASLGFTYDQLGK